MKILLLTTIIIFVLFLIPMSLAQEYNLSCIFRPKIKLVNISLDAVGTGDYFPYLVENNQAFYSVNLITIGNWSKYQYNIHHRTIVQCDGEQRALGTLFEINSYKLSNGTVMSNFINDGKFNIPEGKKHCQVILTKIYATNRSWEEESGCEYGINNCLCFVKGLSGNTKSINKEVLTKEQFFAKKAIITSKEIAEEQSIRDRWNIIIGAVIGSVIAGVFTIVGVIKSERSAKNMIKLDKIYEEIVKVYNKFMPSKKKKLILTTEDRERKIRFIEILLTIGSLLGTALTISNVVEIWELSLISLCSFLLFSIIYYNSITYNPLKKAKDISNLKNTSFIVAISFSVLFSNVIAKPIISNLTRVFQSITQISADMRIISESIIALIIIFAYLGVTTYTIYVSLTRGITHKNKKRK